MRTIPTPEELKRAYGTAPAPVREALDGGSATDFVLGLQGKYPIHVDVLGLITDLVRDLLLGFCTPDDFYAELKLLMGEENADSIIESFNTEVVSKIRIAEHGEDGVVSKQPERSPAALTAEPDTAPRGAVGGSVFSVPSQPTPVSAPSTSQTPPQPRSEPPVLVPQPAVPVSMPPAPTVPPQVPAPAPAYAPPGEQDGPSVRTMATDMQAVREHRAAAPIPYAPSAPMPSTPVPAPEPYVPPAAARSVPPPPPNLPGTGPATKEYGVDPYREPVE